MERFVLRSAPYSLLSCFVGICRGHHELLLQDIPVSSGLPLSPIVGLGLAY